MPMWKRMNEKIMEKVLDFLEDKKHTVVRMWRRYIKMARPRRPKVKNPKTRKWMYAWWNMSTPDKKYAKRHNQTLAQTLRLEARQRKLYFCFFCLSFNTMFNRYLWVNRNSERPSSVGELICLRKTEQKNGQYQQFAQSNNY